MDRQHCSGHPEHLVAAGDNEKARKSGPGTAVRVSKQLSKTCASKQNEASASGREKQRRRTRMLQDLVKI